MTIDEIGNMACDATTGGLGIHLMAKPAGPTCNLRCTYCFYLEKEALFPDGEVRGMSDDVLEAYVRNCVQANRHAPSGIPFVWQGGEPTLLGLAFFKKALQLEKRYAQGRPVTNALQTNGTLLNDEWCEFLARNRFLVGLSLDGPEFLHDAHRHDARGQGTFKAVLRALKLMQKHGVEYNILACVTRESAKHPLDVYRFFKSQGVGFIQFSPVVERMPDAEASRSGLRLGVPPSLRHVESGDVTPWSVEPEAFGDFCIAIFDEWVRHDVGRTFVMNFEWTLHAWMGGEGPVCYLNRRCGDCVIVEHNGDVYSCDHYVYPEFKLGNLLSDNAEVLVRSPQQAEWGRRKEAYLPHQCKECEVGFICRGGCPKHRFRATYLGDPGLNYLCAGYKKFCTHTRKPMQVLAQLAALDLPCEFIMQAVDKPVLIPARAGRNEQSIMLWVK